MKFIILIREVLFTLIIVTLVIILVILILFIKFPKNLLILLPTVIMGQFIYGYRFYKLWIFLFVIWFIVIIGASQVEWEAPDSMKRPTWFVLLQIATSITLCGFLAYYFKAPKVFDFSFNFEYLKYIVALISLSVLIYLSITFFVIHIVAPLFILEEHEFQARLIHYSVDKRSREQRHCYIAFEEDMQRYKIRYYEGYKYKNKTNAVYSYKKCQSFFGIKFVKNIKLIDDSNAGPSSWEVSQESATSKAKFIIKLIVLAGIITFVIISFILAVMVFISIVG